MQDNWVDFKAIKTAVTIQAVLNRYQINWLRKNGEELSGQCPIHQGEGRNSFHVHLGKNAFNCFSCKARGNVNVSRPILIGLHMDQYVAP